MDFLTGQFADPLALAPDGYESALQQQPVTIQKNVQGSENSPEEPKSMLIDERIGIW